MNHDRQPRESCSQTVFAALALSGDLDLIAQACQQRLVDHDMAPDHIRVMLRGMFPHLEVEVQHEARRIAVFARQHEGLIDSADIARYAPINTAELCVRNIDPLLLGQIPRAGLACLVRDEAADLLARHWSAVRRGMRAADHRTAIWRRNALTLTSSPAQLKLVRSRATQRGVLRNEHDVSVVLTGDDMGFMYGPVYLLHDHLPFLGRLVEERQFAMASICTPGADKALSDLMRLALSPICAQVTTGALWRLLEHWG